MQPPCPRRSVLQTSLTLPIQQRPTIWRARRKPITPFTNDSGANLLRIVVERVPEHEIGAPQVLLNAAIDANTFLMGRLLERWLV